jgi:hypothetical protein
MYRTVAAKPVLVATGPRPTIRVATPPENSVIAINTNLLIRSDVINATQFKCVEAFIDDTKIGETAGAPWTFIWMAKPGQHTLQLKVTLKNNRSELSPAVRFRVE